MKAKKIVMSGLLGVAALFSTMSFANHGPAHQAPMHTPMHPPVSQAHYPHHSGPVRGGFFPRIVLPRIVMGHGFYHHPHPHYHRHHQRVIVVRR